MAEFMEKLWQNDDWALSVFRSYNYLPSCKKSEKTNEY